MSETETSGSTAISTAFDWHDTPETFQFLHYHFDVQAAKKCIREKPRGINNMAIAGVADLVGLPGEISMGIAIDWDTAQADSTDMEIPIILVPFHDSYLPIDGWHRIGKAKVTDRAKLPCVVLTAEETKLISNVVDVDRERERRANPPKPRGKPRKRVKTY